MGGWQGFLGGEQQHQLSCPSASRTQCSIMTARHPAIDTQRIVMGPRDACNPPHDPTPPLPIAAGNSREILFRDISVQAHMVHAMGADGRAILSVFEGSRMRIGTVEMHR